MHFRSLDCHLCQAHQLRASMAGSGREEANGTTTETGRDPCLWHANEAVYESRSEMTISLRRCARAELVDVERMIKIGYPLFGGRRNVLNRNFVDLQRGVGAHTVEEPRGGWGFGCGAHGAERVSIAPNCLNPPPPVHSSEQLGADQSIRHWPRDQLLKTSHEFGLAVRVDCCGHVGENSLAHAAPFPAFQAIGPCCGIGQPHGVDRTSDGVLAAAIGC
jgi:hypothetical protein